ncbi:hypothetical protein Efla_005804 [Eimeria flavescens]
MSMKVHRYDEMGVAEFQQLAEEKQASDGALRFWYFRFRFMNPTTPFVPHQEGQFSFGEFLTERLSETLLHMVEIPISTWLLFIPVVLCARPVLGFNPKPLTAFLLFAGAGLLFCNLFIFWRLETIKFYHTPTRKEIETYLLELERPGYQSQVPPAPIDSLPPITRNGALCSLVRGARIMNAQESLFLFGPRGIPVLQTLIQLSLSLHIVVVTAIVKLLVSPHYQHIMFGVLGYWSGFAPLALILLSISIFPTIATQLTIISNIGSMASRQAIAASAEKVQLQLLERQFQILQFLRHKAEVYFASQPGRARDEIEEARQLYDSLSPEIQKGYQDIFHAFAELADQPRIPLKNIMTMIDAFSLGERIPDCKHKADGWVAALDPSGSLTYPAFTALVMHLLEDETRSLVPAHLRAARIQVSLATLFFLHGKLGSNKGVQDLFDFLDEDADGFITVDDLLENLVGLKPAASEEELEQLVAAISHGARGELIGLTQLTSWIDEVEDRARELCPKGSLDH